MLTVWVEKFCIGGCIQVNNYPEWWDKTITVYNRYEDPQTHVISWFRHVLDKCFYKDVGNTVNINNVQLETNNIICRIPIKDNYLAPYEWNALSNDAKPNYFTLKQDDIIVLGEVDDVIDEYTTGSRSTDLKKKYKALQGCLEIQQVGNNTGTGLGNEHYHVNGI